MLKDVLRCLGMNPLILLLYIKISFLSKTVLHRWEHITKWDAQSLCHLSEAAVPCLEHVICGVTRAVHSEHWPPPWTGLREALRVISHPFVRTQFNTSAVSVINIHHYRLPVVMSWCVFSSLFSSNSQWMDVVCHCSGVVWEFHDWWGTLFIEVFWD